MDRERTRRSRDVPALLLALVWMLGGFAAVGAADEPYLPASLTHSDRLVDLEAVPLRGAPAVDRLAVAAEDDEREAGGLPPRFAVPHVVDLTPATSGLWETAEPGESVWRLRVGSPGAASLNLGFARYRMPPGGRLLIYSADLTQVVRPFTSRDNEAHGELWTPVVPADELVIEVKLPSSDRDALELELKSINVGYRGLGESAAPAAGACNVDVVCPDGDAWREEIPSVGAISTGGSTYCTGFMVNNTNQDRTPYFITGAHCGISSVNAASLVVYWNFETSTCAGPRDGPLTSFQTGSIHRATYTPSDCTLVELDDLPDPAWEVTYAGWDRSGADASSAVGIHHPRGDEKSISHENDPTTTTSYVGTTSPGDGNYVRVTDWDSGTTEGGSSGSPLFDQNHRVIGQLHGGYAACGNDASDWYGKFAVSWDGGGGSSSRLKDWLDPGGTGAITLDTLGHSACNHDGQCDPDESCESCPNDCISVPGAYCCGDTVCEGAENSDNCAVDCVGCGDASCDPARGENPCSCPDDCGSPPAAELGAACADGEDNDCDGSSDCSDGDCVGSAGPDADLDGEYHCEDCDDADGDVWGTPGIVDLLDAIPNQTWSWSVPADPGATSVTYDLLRSATRSDFTAASCPAEQIEETSVADATQPNSGEVFYYLVRAVNACPAGGVGSVGLNGVGGFRTVSATCP